MGHNCAKPKMFPFQIPHHQLYSVCQQLGTICELRGRDFLRPTVEIVLVRTTKTDRMKPRSKITIANTECYVEWVRDESNCVEMPHVSESLEPSPSQQSPQHIMNRLNYDCFRAIFESDHLSLSDLCSIGSVCRLFNAIASDVFAAKYKDEDACSKSIGSKHLWQTEEYFRIAGNISSIDSRHFVDLETVAEMIMKYCTNVKRLDWRCVGRPRIIDDRSLLANLTHLTLRCSGAIDLTDVLPPNSSLECLHLCDIAWNSRLPNVHLPNLVGLILKNVYPLESLEQFLHLNRHIKTLTIDAYMVHSFGLDRVIGYLPNVEEMNIVDESSGRHATDYVALSRLSHLKRLRVQSDAMLTGVPRVIIDERLPLDCLIMDNPKALYPMKELAQLRTVKCLKLGRINWHYLKTYANEMCDADEIEIFTEFICLSSIPEILCVWKRTKKVTFRILVYDEYPMGDDPVRDVQAIADICMERGQDVRIVVEVDVNCYREDIVEVRVALEWLLVDRNAER